MKLTINLSSRRYVNDIALNWTGGAISVLLLLLIFYQASLCFQAHRLVQKYRLDVAELKQQISDRKTLHMTEEQVEQQKNKIAVARSLLRKDAFRWTALLDRLERLLPEKVSIHSLSPNYQTNSLKLTGAAQQLEDLQTFLDNLHNDAFSQVLFKSQEMKGEKNSTGKKKSLLFFSLELEGVF